MLKYKMAVLLLVKELVPDHEQVRRLCTEIAGLRVRLLPAMAAWDLRVAQRTLKGQRIVDDVGA